MEPNPNYYYPEGYVPPPGASPQEYVYAPPPEYLPQGPPPPYYPPQAYAPQNYPPQNYPMQNPQVYPPSIIPAKPQVIEIHHTHGRGRGRGRTETVQVINNPSGAPVQIIEIEERSRGRHGGRHPRRGFR